MPARPPMRASETYRKRVKAISTTLQEIYRCRWRPVFDDPFTGSTALVLPTGEEHVMRPWFLIKNTPLSKLQETERVLLRIVERLEQQKDT